MRVSRGPRSAARLGFALALLLHPWWLAPARAQLVELVSKSAGGVPSDTAGGSSYPRGLSADGRFVLFESQASNLIAGQVDANNESDLFLYDRDTGTLTLVSRAEGTTTTTANERSTLASMTPDASFIVFHSLATDLVPGQLDVNGKFDVFLFERATGAVSLVSHAVGSASQAGNDSSAINYLPSISDDGGFVAFESWATDLVSGIADTNAGSDVFLFERASGNVSLVSRAFGLAAAANGSSGYPHISGDGAFVSYSSLANNLVSGQIDPFSKSDAFLFERATGTTVLVSHAAGAATTASDGDTYLTWLSNDGGFVALASASTNLVPSQVDPNSAEDVFLFERATGTMVLVSHRDGSAIETGDMASAGFGAPEAVSISADGGLVAFESLASNLAPGQIDLPGSDVFLFDRTTGAVSLLSHESGSPTTSGNSDSFSPRLSADGSFVAFFSHSTNLVAGQSDVNGTGDVVLYDLGASAATLVSRRAGTTTATANSGSTIPLIDASGAHVLYPSGATDLEAAVSDLNSNYDVFLFETLGGVNRTVSLAATPSAAGGGWSSPFRGALSDDGRYTVFESQAQNLVPGQVDTLGTYDLFLFDRTSGDITLVSRRVGFPTTAGNGASTGASISANGDWVVFRSGARNLVAGQVDTNSADDTFLYHRPTGTMSLVSHTALSAVTAGNRAAVPESISSDGAFVLFSSTGNNFVPSQVDGLTTSDLFLYETATGNIALVSHAQGAMATAANGASPLGSISADGSWVAFSSRGTNLVAGQVDTNAVDDVFLYERASQVNVLVSRASGTAATAGNGASVFGRALSVDGGYVVYKSRATNLVSGQIDANGSDDVFVYERAAGTATLVSRRDGTTATAGSHGSLEATITPDGTFIAFRSASVDLVPGQSDPVARSDNGDVFLFERATGVMTLVSRKEGTLSTTGDGASRGASVSADGSFVGFFSEATDLVSGQSDANGLDDVFLYERATGAMTLASRRAGTASVTGNEWSRDSASISFQLDMTPNAGLLVFWSRADDLVYGDLNDQPDVFLFSRSTPTSNLTVTKTDSQLSAVPGTSITYEITVTNHGPASLGSLTLNDALPPEILGPAFSPSEGSYDPPTGAWTGLSLDPSESITLTLSGTIDPAARGTLINNVTAFPDPPVVDPLPGDNLASDENTLTPLADLSITKTDGADPIGSGDPLTYTVTVSNLGPSLATGVVVTDDLPPVSFVSSTPGAPDCGYANGRVTCSLGSLAPSAMASIGIDVVANSLALVNQAAVTATETDPDSSNNLDLEETTIIVPGDAVRFLTARATSGSVLLEWVNPAPVDYLATHIVANVSGFPLNETDGTVVYSGGTAGGKDSFDHTGLVDGTTYYYGGFVERTAGFSSGRFTRGRPFDSSGAVKWAFTTGAASMAPPAIGPVYVVSNDRVLYSLRPGSTGGDWTSSFTPYQVPEPVQSRPPVVPVDVGPANKVVFLGSQDGRVYAVNAATGEELWPSPLLGDRVQAAPAGIFTRFAGDHDLILVGSRNSDTDNLFYGLELPDGSIAWQFDNLAGSGGIGIVSAGAAVDYANNRVYFASRERSGGSTSTLWCLDFTDSSGTLKWERALGNIDGSPILLGPKVYAGTNAGEVHALDAETGADLWSAPFATSDGPVKGFIFPDRSTNRLYFSTTSKVWSIFDDGGSASLNWSESSIETPSVPLVAPWLGRLLVGSGDGKLYQLGMSGPVPTITSVVLGDGGAAVGPPALDIATMTVYVGTDAGFVYAVSVPLP